jgi:hypothetical protein
VGDYGVGGEHSLAAFGGRDELGVVKMARLEPGRTDLREDLAARARARSFVDRRDQAIERQLGSHRHEDHSTAPR